MKKISLALGSFLLPMTAHAANLPFNPRVNPIPEQNLSVTDILLQTIYWVLGFAAAIAVLFLIIGGILYVTAAGNTDRAKTARQTILYAVIGLIVIVLAFVILGVVTGTLNTLI